MTDQLHGPVVVGIDGSEASRQAAVYGAWEADRLRVAVRLVGAHQIVPPWGPAVAVVDDAWEHGWLRDILDEARARVSRIFPDVEVEVAARTGGAAAVLVDESRSASLVVLATHASGGLVGHLSGSITAQVAAHSHAPVVALRAPHDRYADPAAFVGKRVVIGLDGSQEAQHALAFAVDEAIARQAELHAVYVWDLFTVHEIRPLVAPDFDLEEAQEKATRLLTEATSGWSDRYPELKIAHVAVHELETAETIAQYASDAGLIVVGSRGKGGFLNLRLGSTVDALLRCASVPVAAVRGEYPERR